MLILETSKKIIEHILQVRSYCASLSIKIKALWIIIMFLYLDLINNFLINCTSIKCFIYYFFRHFPNIKKDEAIGRPILYSNWMDKNYVAVDREELRHYVKARLKVFYEEELDVPLVLFDEVLDHVLRIDRIFR